MRIILCAPWPTFQISPIEATLIRRAPPGGIPRHSTDRRSPPFCIPCDNQLSQNGFLLTPAHHDFASAFPSRMKLGRHIHGRNVSIMGLVSCSPPITDKTLPTESTKRHHDLRRVSAAMVFGKYRTSLGRALRRPKCNELLGAGHLVVSTASRPAYRRTTRDCAVRRGYSVHRVANTNVEVSTAGEAGLSMRREATSRTGVQAEPGSLTMACFLNHSRSRSLSELPAGRVQQAVRD